MATKAPTQCPWLWIIHGSRRRRSGMVNVGLVILLNALLQASDRQGLDSLSYAQSLYLQDDSGKLSPPFGSLPCEMQCTILVRRIDSCD